MRGLLRRRRSVSGVAFCALITVSAVLGGLSVPLVAVGALFGVRPIIVISGSMAPGIPVGSMIFVRTVSATEVRVGDIVTVPRNDGGKGEITHRVVLVSAEGGKTVLRLKGDANSIEDPLPYRSDTAGKFLFHIPEAGTLALAARTPLGLTALGLYVAAMVMGIVCAGPRRREVQDDQPCHGRQGGVEAAG